MKNLIHRIYKHATTVTIIAAITVKTVINEILISIKAEPTNTFDKIFNNKNIIKEIPLNSVILINISIIIFEFFIPSAFFIANSFFSVLSRIPI